MTPRPKLNVHQVGGTHSSHLVLAASHCPHLVVHHHLNHGILCSIVLCVVMYASKFILLVAVEHSVQLARNRRTQSLWCWVVNW